MKKLIDILNEIKIVKPGSLEELKGFLEKNKQFIINTLLDIEEDDNIHFQIADNIIYVLDSENYRNGIAFSLDEDDFDPIKMEANNLITDEFKIGNRIIWIGTWEPI